MADTSPGPSEVAQRAIATFKQHNFDEAIPLLRQAIEFDRESFNLWMYLGAALGHREKWADAERAFAKAEEIDGSSAEASYMLGIAIAKQGRLREAHGQFMVALGNDPDHAKAKAAAEKTATAAAQVTKDGSSAAAPGGLAGLDLGTLELEARTGVKGAGGAQADVAGALKDLEASNKKASAKKAGCGGSIMLFGLVLAAAPWLARLLG